MPYSAEKRGIVDPAVLHETPVLYLDGDERKPSPHLFERYGNRPFGFRREKNGKDLPPAVEEHGGGRPFKHFVDRKREGSLPEKTPSCREKQSEQRRAEDAAEGAFHNQLISTVPGVPTAEMSGAYIPSAARGGSV